jgi:hypothetical protein
MDKRQFPEVQYLFLCVIKLRDTTKLYGGGTANLTLTHTRGFENASTGTKAIVSGVNVKKCQPGRTTSYDAMLNNV